GCDLGDVADLRGEVVSERVDVVRQVLPRAADALDVRLAAEAPLGAHFLCDARYLRGERPQLVDHRVNGLLQLGHLARRLDRARLRDIALCRSGCDLGDVAHLRREVVRERVDVVGQVLPRPGDALDLRLAAEDALGADLAGDARDLVREGR